MTIIINKKKDTLKKDISQSALKKRCSDLGYLLGVDGGGTKTIALIARDNGEIVGRGKGGPANILFNTQEEVHSAIVEAIEQALAVAEIEGEQVAQGVFGVPAPQDIFAHSLSSLLPNANISFLGEAPIAFASGSDKSFGLLLIAGTGSFSWGRSEDGCIATTGGGGAAFGDEGSGFDLGRMALREISKMYDGRGPETLLAEKVNCLIGSNSFDGILSYVYGKQDKRSYRSRISALAPAVLDAGKEKDLVACQIIDHAAFELELLVVTCARKLNMFTRHTDLVLTGGVLRHGGPLLDTLLSRLAKSLPNALPIIPEIEPAAGAIKLAKLFRQSPTLEPSWRNLQKQFVI